MRLIIGIKENEAEDFNLSVFPNPATNQVTLSYQLANSSISTIELFDVLGNKISSLSLAKSAGKHQTIINTENLSKGAYLIKLSSEKGNSSKLIIKN